MYLKSNCKAMGRAHLPHSLLRAYNNVVRLARVCQNRCHYWTCTLRFCLSDIAAYQVHPYTGCVCVLSGINRLVIYFYIQVVPYQLVRLLFLFSVRVFFYIHWRFTGQQGKGEGPCFIPIYQFYPLTNIQSFICNFAYEMTTMYF